MKIVSHEKEVVSRNHSFQTDLGEIIYLIRYL